MENPLKVSAEDINKAISNGTKDHIRRLFVYYEQLRHDGLKPRKYAIGMILRYIAGKSALLFSPSILDTEFLQDVRIYLQTRNHQSPAVVVGDRFEVTSRGITQAFVVLLYAEDVASSIELIRDVLQFILQYPGFAPRDRAAHLQSYSEYLELFKEKLGEDYLVLAREVQVFLSNYKEK